MSRSAHIIFGIFSTLTLIGCGGGTSTCESMWNNECDQGCSCPGDLKCRINSDGFETRGRNACYRDCTKDSDCPESTHCVEVSVGTPSGEELQGQCWPTCGERCPGATQCQSTQLYPDAGPIRACF